MACFLVPAAEAVVSTVAAKIVKAKESEPIEIKFANDAVTYEPVQKIPFSRKLKWLTNMLWGGSVLLAFEHVWHGEVVPWFPFLTAASDPAEASLMLQEMATVGVSMAVLITAVWCGMLIAVKAMEKKALKAQPAAN